METLNYQNDTELEKQMTTKKDEQNEIRMTINSISTHMTFLPISNFFRPLESVGVLGRLD